MADVNYLGVGEKYSLTPDINAGIELIRDRELIKQSIYDILSTPKGTHFPNEEYGCNIYLMTFQPNDKILVSLGIYFISEALFNWEKRIRVLDVYGQQVNVSETNFIVQYRILASNEIDSFVYPFYKELKV